jgi:hypothetical protein
MRQKLTLVVTCTDRKSMAVSQELRLRSLADSQGEERVALWTRRLERPVSRRPLRQLYQGETWTQVARLERAADRAGFNPQVLVASAGLGLRRVDDIAPAYAATFSDGHLDSVPGDVHEKQWWWRQLGEASNSESLMSDLAGPMLLVLSERYSRVLAPEIEHFAERDDVLVVGGSEEVPAHLRLPADRGLRSVLGGTTTSLNARTAVAWLERLANPTLVSDEVRTSWESWANRVRRSDVYDRQQVSDQAVLDYITQLREGEPTMSKTRALRHLRDAGLACEQRRFGDLFERPVGVR